MTCNRGSTLVVDARLRMGNGKHSVEYGGGWAVLKHGICYVTRWRLFGQRRSTQLGSSPSARYRPSVAVRPPPAAILPRIPVATVLRGRVEFGETRS